MMKENLELGAATASESRPALATHAALTVRGVRKT